MSSACDGAGLLDQWRLQVHEVLPSTSILCRERAVAGEAAGLAVLALRQTQGRGSRGRGWESPAGNLSLSVLLRPNERVSESAQWSLIAGVALGEALASYLPDPSPLRLKWPNDVQLNGGKLAGILVDSSAGSSGMLEWLVVGMGANLAVAPEVPGRAVACLADVVPPPRPEQVAEAVLARLAHWQTVRRTEGFAPVRAAWLARAHPPGSQMTLRLGDDLIGGAFAGLGTDGSLLLETDGVVRTFTAGEILQ